MSFDDFVRVALPDLGYNPHRFRGRRARRQAAAAMRERGVCSWEAYRQCLSDPAAQRALRSRLTVTISRFWRNSVVFRDLERTVLPDVMRHLAPGEPLTVWSAGGASGQEAYSVAMLAEALPAAFTREHPFRIVASDISWDALRRGARGAWTASELKELPREVRLRAYRDAGDVPVLTHSVRATVVLVQGCLFGPGPVSRAHLVLCRNSVMTYFHGTAREEAMARVVGALTPHGWLVLGRKEQLPQRWAARWSLVHTGRQIYQLRPR